MKEWIALLSMKSCVIYVELCAQKSLGYVYVDFCKCITQAEQISISVPQCKNIFLWLYVRVWESASCSPLWRQEEEKLWNVHSLSLLNSGSSRLPMSFPLLLCFGVNGLKRGGGQCVMTLSSAIFLYSQHLPHPVQWLPTQPSPPWTPKCPGLPQRGVSRL